MLFWQRGQLGRRAREAHLQVTRFAARRHAASPVRCDTLVRQRYDAWPAGQPEHAGEAESGHDGALIGVQDGRH